MIHNFLRIFCYTLITIVICSCGAPSLNGNWFVSIPYSEDGMDGKADINLFIGSAMANAGQITGIINLSGSENSDAGNLDFVANINLVGTWRIVGNKLYASFQSFKCNINPQDVTFTPNVTSEEGLMAAVGPGLFNSLLSGFTGFSLPMDDIVSASKSYMIKEFENELNRYLKDLVGPEELIGKVLLQRNCFILTDDDENLPIGCGQQLIFYRR